MRYGVLANALVDEDQGEGTHGYEVVINVTVEAADATFERQYTPRRVRFDEKTRKLYIDTEAITE
jgi:hypothetical protein